ncbi:MAG: hypothetical protein P4L83_00190 [Nevskia sp.]|nr:hypothetical protein [Nevskia sp.]
MAWPGASRCASRMVNITTAVSTLPHSTVHSATPATSGRARHTPMPATIATRQAAIAARFTVAGRRSSGSARLIATVATPYQGQMLSASAGRCRNSRAISGRKVAGTA